MDHLHSCGCNANTSMPSVLESLNTALHRAFTDNLNVYLLGEDILDPYGGAFKVSRGLSTNFPERVLTTPISEAGFVGVAAGMALRGLRPVVEIMFGDFVTLIADQMINHIAKFRWMYNNQVGLPIVIRTPMGGRRGYGPTHSQTLEKLYLGIPGLRVVAPAAFSQMDGSGSPGDLLYHSILHNDDPLLFIENKLQYILPVQSQMDLLDFTLSDTSVNEVVEFPCFILSIRGAPPANLTITAYGFMSELAKQATNRLAFEHEIFVELVVPTQLSPFEIMPIIDSARKTGALLVVEEGTLSMGWGAELLARVAEAIGSHPINVKRLAAKEVPVPSSGTLEDQVLPGIEQIIQSAIQMIQ
jgi:pyruvate/2-oxoglutarate/acetoin dehydrogenase E1 component